MSLAADCAVIFWDLKREAPDQKKTATLGAKHLLWADANDGELRRHNGRLVAADHSAAHQLLACAFSGGVFAVYETSGEHRCACVHRLSVARGDVDAIALDRTGDRVAMGSRRFGQLVVWEWRSEAFALAVAHLSHDA